MKTTHSLVTRTVRNLVKDVTKQPWFPAKYLTDVPTGSLVEADGQVFEVKVIQRRNMGVRHG